MTNSKKKRMTLLDNLAAGSVQRSTSSKTPDPAKESGGSMMGNNRALRSARDAVDGHHVWELDPECIDDLRPVDRLDPNDVTDLREAIEANGQTVPILVRRNPQDDKRYLLIYGRRRLEAIRQSRTVSKIRAIVANMDDDSAIRAQISENMARRDLSFIEKALLAKSLVSSGLGNQSQVAEILTVTKSSVSMAISIVDTIQEPLVRAIGPALSVGRPRWETLARSIEERGCDRDHLIDLAYTLRDKAALKAISGNETNTEDDISLTILSAIEKAVGVSQKTATPTPARSKALKVDGLRTGLLKRTAKAVTLSFDDGEFATWVETKAQDLVNELHARWQQDKETNHKKEARKD